MKLTDEQTQWFIANFKHTKNDEIKARLGISTSYLHILARKLGLKKTPEFMRQCQANAVAAAQIAIANEDEEAKERRRQQANQNRKNNLFRKGVWALANKTAEELAEINARRKASWAKTRKADEARLNFGRARKTKFRFAKHPDPEKNQRIIKIRCYLRSPRRRYEIPDRGGMVIYITPETRRSPKMEEVAKKLGMIVREKKLKKQNNEL